MRIHKTDTSSNQQKFNQVSDGSANYLAPAEHQQPPLSLLSFLLNSVTSALERAAEEKYLLLNKVNELTSQL